MALKKSRFKIEDMANWPWVSIAFCVLAGWYILTKIGNSGTWLGSMVSKLTNPSEYDKEQAVFQQVASTMVSPESGRWTKKQNLIDANDIANALKTNKQNDIWYKGFTEDEDTAYAIVLQYTNKVQYGNLETFYRTMSTNNRSLRTDLLEYLRDGHIAWLRKKGII